MATAKAMVTAAEKATANTNFNLIYKQERPLYEAVFLVLDV